MSLQAPWFLLGLGLLALPWILHLFSKHVAPEKLFPSKQFLEATEPPKSRTRQLQHKALLLLRLLMLLMLCLLFASPWINRTKAVAQLDYINYLVVDHSMSMSSEGRWESALKHVDDWLANNSTESSKMFTFDTELKKTSRKALKEPGYLRADFGDLIRQLDIRASDEELPVIVTLITDAQSTAVPAHKNAMYGSTLNQLVVKTVGDSDQQNFSVAAEARSYDSVHAHFKVTLSASSGNSNDSVERTVSIMQNNKTVATRKVSISAGQNVDLVFEQVALPANNNMQFSVQVLEEDALLKDNQAVVTVVGTSPETISIVQYNNLASEAALVFLDTALRADGVAVMSSASETDLAKMEGRGHVIAFVSERDKDNLPESLDNFIRLGGNALVVLASGDVRSSSTEDTTGGEVTFVDPVHSLALTTSDWSSVKIYANKIKLDPKLDQVLLQSATGTPLLWERQSSGGNVFMLHDSLDGIESNLPHQAAFVELVHSVVNYFSQHDVVPSVLEVGQSVSLPARMGLLNPNNKSIGSLQDASKARQYQLIEPGIYTVLQKDSERPLSVLLNTAESDIAPMPTDSIDLWQSTVSNKGVDKVDSQISSALNPETTKQPLWQLLLPLFAGLLLLESLFANRHLNVKRDGSL